MSDPRLSISIPTYNRQDWLRIVLEKWQAEILPFGDRVEIVIVDNASPDATAQVVQEAQKRGPIQYYRNEKNVGVLKNLHLAAIRPKGNFVWMCGDDDLPFPGAVARALAAIDAHPTLNYFYVKYHHWLPERAPRSIDVAGVPSTPAHPASKSALYEKGVEIVRGDYNCMTNIYAVIWSQKHIRAAFLVRDDEGPARFDTPLGCVRHGLYIANHLALEPCYLIAEPGILASYVTHWGDNGAMDEFLLHVLPEVAETYLRNGAPADIFREHKNRYIRDNYHSLLTAISTHNWKFLRKFRFARFVRRNWAMPALYGESVSLVGRAITHLPRRLLHKGK